MIRVQRRPLASATRRGLAAYQRQLAGCAPGDSQIKRQWQRFTNEKVLRPQVLTVMQQQSDCKCVYCENEDASTIDHFYPKMEYPARTFQWENFNLACWGCNHAKGTFFPRSGRRPIY